MLAGAQRVVADDVDGDQLGPALVAGDADVAGLGADGRPVPDSAQGRITPQRPELQALAHSWVGCERGRLIFGGPRGLIPNLYGRTAPVGIGTEQEEGNNVFVCTIGASVPPRTER